MKKVIFLLVFLLNLNSFAEPNIVNGYDIAREKALHLVKVFHKTGGACTGFIISESIVVTAAHCVLEKTKSDISISVMKKESSFPWKYKEKIVDITKIYSSQKYSLEKKLHDQKLGRYYFQDGGKDFKSIKELDESLRRWNIVKGGAELANYDFALLQTKKAFKEIVALNKHAKIPNNQRETSPANKHEVIARKGDKINIMGFGSTYTQMSDHKKKYKSQLRYGENYIDDVNRKSLGETENIAGYLSIKGRLNQGSHYTNWFYDKSNFSWGDSGGPVSLASNNRYVVGIISMHDMRHLIYQDEFDPTHNTSITYSCDLGSLYVQNVIHGTLERIGEQN